MSLLLSLLAGSALDVGTSPLVEPGHTNDWVVIQDDEEGAARFEAAWRSETVVDGANLKLALQRTDVRQPEIMVVDAVLAVDCQGERIGIKRIWIHESTLGSNAEVPVVTVEMDFADTPPREEDLKIFNFASGTGPATQ